MPDIQESEMPPTPSSFGTTAASTPVMPETPIPTEGASASISLHECGLPIFQNQVIVPLDMFNIFFNYCNMLMTINQQVRNVTSSGQLLIPTLVHYSDWRYLFQASNVRTHLIFQDSQDKTRNHQFFADEVPVVGSSVYTFRIIIQLEHSVAQQAARNLGGAINSGACTVSLWRKQTELSNIQVQEIDSKCITTSVLNRDTVVVQIDSIKIFACSDKHNDQRFFFHVTSIHEVAGLSNIFNAPVLITTKNNSIHAVSKKQPDPKQFSDRKIQTVQNRPQAKRDLMAILAPTSN